ncbi:MAG: TM0106 family RecB-like putative nuclease, partial [Cyanobacteria bacterium J06623_7]
MLISDHLLLNYKRCNRRVFLEWYGDSEARDADKDFLLKLKRENRTHIKNVIAARSLAPEQPSASRRDWQLNAQQTVQLMQQGVDCIARGTLSVDYSQWRSLLDNDDWDRELTSKHQDFLAQINFTAAPSLLIKQPGESVFGNWEYLPVNIKLGRKPKPEYKLISAFHSQILTLIQGKSPTQAQIILKEYNSHQLNLSHWMTKTQSTVLDCLKMLAKRDEPEVFISRQRCSLCSWHSYCHQVAQSSKHLSLIPGVTPKRYEHLQALGIDSAETLIDVPTDILAEALSFEVAERLKQQIKAIQRDRPAVRSNFDLVNTQPIPSGAIELYFDIEAEPERQIDYLLGVLLVDRQQNTEKFYAFLAENPEEEGTVWQEFLDFLDLYPDAPIFHYSEYEVDTIKRLARLYGTPKWQKQEILSRLVDLHFWVNTAVIFPVESYSLKAIANWIGFYWRETTASG